MSPEEQDELAMRWLGPGNTYEKLGVPCSAYEEKVIKAHRNLIKKLHPDKNKSPRADEAFKVMSNEVEVLLNVNSRRKYDEQLLIKSRPFRISSIRCAWRNGQNYLPTTSSSKRTRRQARDS